MEEKFIDNPSYWLMVEIVRLTQCPQPTMEQWNSWMAANQTVIGRIANKNWSMLPGNKAIHAPDYPNMDLITKEPNPPFDQFDIASQAILSPSGPIPQLWLWIGKAIQGKIYEPAVAQDVWLAEAMARMFDAYGVEQTQDRDAKVIEFIKRNRATIDKIRSAFAKQPVRLGAGADGVAYDIGQDRVLKVFKDRQAFVKAMEAIKRLHKQPQVAKTEAMIYDAGLLGSFQRYEDQTFDIYYYIMEKMTPLRDYYGVDEEVRKILKYVATYIRNDAETFQDLKQQIRDPEDLDNVKKEVARLAENMAAGLMARSGSLLDKIEDKIPTLRRGWLSSYIEEIMIKFITGRGDLHMGNLGVTSYGDLRYYDPSHEDWTDAINVPEKNPFSASYPQRNTKSPTSQSDEE